MNRPLTFKQVLLICTGVSFFWIALIIYCLPLFILGYDLNTERWAHLGDTVNGLLGPIIAIGAGLLIFFSFQQQVKANRIVTDQLLLNSLYNTIDVLLIEAEKIADEFKYDMYNDGKKIIGLSEYIKNFRNCSWAGGPNAYKTLIHENNINLLLSIMNRVAQILDSNVKLTGTKTAYHYKLITLHNRFFGVVTANDLNYFSDYYCKPCYKKHAFSFYGLEARMYQSSVKWVQATVIANRQ